MPAIGITGGIGTGKSTLTRCLRGLLPEAAFFDADAMARELTASDQSVLAEIRKEFGDAVFAANGELNRAALRAIVFHAPDRRRALEEILHPRIRQRWSAEADQHRGTTDFYFADIPLLYETGGDTLCDRVVVVACTAETQMQRLMQRLDRITASAIIRTQMPLAEKMQRATHVVWNNGPESALAEEARLLVKLWKA
ncbi:MAG: dephospho-CoA kinase [Verrucomicrobiota bacterium]|nr:dephospho-CoA kinase [Verrucomicrobiota bacterium]